MDQMWLGFTTKRQTKRWPLVMFFNILDVSTIACREIYKIKNPDDELSKKNNRSSFIRDIGFGLMRSLTLRRYNSQIKVSRPLRETMRLCLTDMRALEQGPVETRTPVQGTQKRGRCGMCNWKDNRKGTSKCHKCKNWLCKMHVDFVCPKCRDQ